MLFSFLGDLFDDSQLIDTLVLDAYCSQKKLFVRKVAGRAGAEDQKSNILTQYPNLT